MILRDIHASILRFCAEFAEGYSEPAMDAINIDAHSDETTIPNTDIVGMSGLSIDVDEHVVGIKVMIGLGTLDDTNLFRLMAQMDALFDKLLPTKNIKVYDADTGEEKGSMVILNGTRMLPVGGTEARPLQYVMVSLLTTRTFDLKQL